MKLFNTAKFLRNIVLSFLLLFIFSGSSLAQVAAQDSLALVAFYNATDGTNWVNKNNWLTTGPVSTWAGITVVNGRVYTLSFLNNNLKGSIPPEIGQLTQMKFLVLSSNQLSGEIPSEISQLKNLETLDLSQNMLTGNIPSEIGTLTSLTQLSLWENQLTGNIPAEIGQMSNLTDLSLRDNQLTGTIPASIWQSNLERISLGNNQLAGTIPSEIGQLTNLTYLGLSGNQFTGDLPQEIGLLTKMDALELNGNQFTGSIPAEIAQWQNLFILSLQNNHFSNLPDLSAMPYARPTVENNRFEFDDLEPNINILNSYSPQDSIGAAEEKTVSILGGNYTLAIATGGAHNTYQWYKDGIAVNYEGTSSSLVNDSPKYGDAGIYTVEVKNNLVTNLTLLGRPITVRTVSGLSEQDSQTLFAIRDSMQLSYGYSTWGKWHISSFPFWKGVEFRNGKVIGLDLSFAHRYGRIPAEIGQLAELESIILSGNHLSGPIPKEFFQLKNLRILILGTPHDEIDVRLWWTEDDFNRFEGVIPKEIGQLTNLEYLNLEHCSLDGIIPPEIGNLKKLKSLLLKHNYLTGNIPTEIGQLENLEEINLYFNALDGIIPPEIGNLTNLTKLDFSLNYLTGNIPPEIGNLTNLTKLDFSDNSLTGNIPTEIGQLKNLKSINLRNNKLGNGNVSLPKSSTANGVNDINDIPVEIGLLYNLTDVDLGNNQFTGRLPSEISNLTELWSLNVSYNFLSGDLPPIENKFSKLQHLDLSYNQLTDSSNVLFGGWINDDYDDEGYSQADSLKSINISNNNFGGSFRFLFKSNSAINSTNSIGDLKNLEVLDIGSNSYTGELSGEVGKLSKLKKLDVGNNKFTGSLPEEIGNLAELEALNLSKNDFSGLMPLSMINLSNLTFFNFDSTQLEVPNDSSFQNWLMNIPDTVTTGIKIEENTKGIPSNFVLEQNYPNPFNPTTTIKYNIPAVETLHATSLQNVSLKIYDMLGREVATLVNEQKAPGIYEVQFDGSGLASGIYLYKLQTGSGINISKKLMLLK